MKLRISKRFTFFSLLTVFLLTSCTRSCSRHAGIDTPHTPEEAVKRFVEWSAEVKDPNEKERIGALCSGELRRAFERMTEESFRVAYLSNSLRIDEFKILSSEIHEGTARVHYRVTLQNTQGTDTTKESNEREVELMSANGSWFIDSIRMMGSDQIAFTRGMIF